MSQRQNNRRVSSQEPHNENEKPKDVDPSINNSISDSKVHCVNRALLRKGNHVARKLWEMGKKIGVTYGGDYKVMMRRIGELEDRDRLGIAGPDQGEQGETKLEKIEVTGLCNNLWGNQELDWDFLPSQGRSGGTLCLWDKDMFRKIAVHKGASFIAIHGE
ncbi:hypothetical protein RIF29_38996 [Crotalaria pallida]|uniref:RNA-directed DNA polymerase, eukaryota, reverse transcriptase zinc-binding domain protein n=1 Tax=Crotalaria pallida TaxID=3830 RepID=A0AAN9E3D6_CROPI